MPKFIVIYHATESVPEQMSKTTPEQMAEGMKPWMAWSERFEDHLIEIGTPLTGGQRVSKSRA